MKPFLSIIIPFFGQASQQLLDRCLQSIHTQGINEGVLEIIIPNDNGKGVETARNNGIAQARGEYLFMVDADDYLFPNTLQTCIDVLKERGPDILTFDFKRVKPDAGQTVKQPAFTLSSEVTGAQYMLSNNFFGVVWRAIIRKELITENQLFFPPKKYHQDEFFMATTYFFAKKVIDIPLIVYAYNQHPGSLLNNPGKRQRAERLFDFYYMLIALCVFREQKYGIHPIQDLALERRISFLTIDYLIQLIRNKASWHTIKRKANRLKVKKLLPLPEKDYSVKYILAWYIINQLFK